MSASAAIAKDIETGTDPHRRLSDKLRLAVKQAIAQGRDQVAEHLLLCNQAIADEDYEFPNDRRGRD